MINIKEIIISAALITSFIGPYPIANAVENHAEASEFAMQRRSSDHRIKTEDCTVISQGLYKPGVVCGQGNLVLSRNDSAGREDSGQDRSESSHRTESEQIVNNGLSPQLWPKNTTSVVSSSHSATRLAPMIDVESYSSEGLTENLRSEPDNAISGSLLASILVLIAIVAVARRNV